MVHRLCVIHSHQTCQLVVMGIVIFLYENEYFCNKDLEDIIMPNLNFVSPHYTTQ